MEYSQTHRPVESRLQQVIGRAAPLEQAAQVQARRRQDQLTKPPGSLGRLERRAIQVARITGEARPPLADKVVIIAAGDHGVAADGVSAYPSEVTGQMVRNFASGDPFAIVVDTEDGPVRLGRALTIAVELGAEYVRLADLSAGEPPATALSATVRNQPWRIRP